MIVDPIAGSVARVFGPSGKLLGAGWLIDGDLVATTAEVAATGPLTVDFPLLAAGHQTGARLHRQPAGQVAVLRLGERPPARVPPMFVPPGLHQHPFRVFGFPPGMADGVWSSGRVATGPDGQALLYSAPHEQPVAEGYAGAPVWDDEVAAVVGMAAPDGAGPARLVPIQHVLGVDPNSLPNPYRGLEPFGEEHADVFYGRDADVDRLAAAVEREPLVVVAGRSGTGKSSLVRAGLFPRLRRAGVYVAEYRTGTGTAPADALAAAVHDLGADRPAVLFADQFEELTGDTAAEALRLLIELVRAAPRMPDGSRSIRAVLTLRWEAMSDLLTDEVADAVRHGTVSLAPMNRPQLRAAIEGPARRLPGLAFEPGLVERILDDAGDGPGQLPLVESLLSQLWAGRRGGTLTLADYHRLGGVAGALTQHAEAALTAFADLTAVRSLLTRLARPAEGTDFLRAAARFDDLPAELRAVADVLLRSRIVVAGSDPGGTRFVELAHQALIDHWPRLGSWLAEDREFLRWQQELDQHRMHWEAAGRDPGALLRGTALARAEEWLADREADVPPPQREFVRTAGARQRRDSRLRRGALAVLATIVLVAVGLGVLFGYQRGVSATEAADAASRQLAAWSADASGTDPAKAVLLALAAHRAAPTPESERALFTQYLENRDVDTLLSGSPGSIENVDASADGRVVAARTEGGIVTVWTRRPGGPVKVRQLQPGTQAYAVDVAPDGSGVLLVEKKHTWLYDPVSGKKRALMPGLSGSVIDVHATLGPDGVLLAIQRDDGNLLQMWRAAGERYELVGERRFPMTRTPVAPRFTPTPDTAVLTVLDEKTTLERWNARTGKRKVLADDVAQQPATEVTGDGRLVVCRGSAGQQRIVLISVDDGAETRSVDLPEAADCRSYAADADATTVVAGGAAFNLRTGDKLVPPTEAPSTGTLIDDGKQLLTLNHDDAGIRFTPVREQPRPIAQQQKVKLTPDGRYAVRISSEATDIVVTSTPGEARPLARAKRPTTYYPYPHYLAISPDGRLLADRTDVDTVQVRTLPDLKLVQEITTPALPSEENGLRMELAAEVAFDGDRLLTTVGARAQWWDPRSGRRVAAVDLRELGIAKHELDVDRIAPYPRPGTVAALVSGELHIVKVTDGRRVDRIELRPDAEWFDVQQDGRYLLLKRRGGLVELWDAERWARVLGPIRSDDFSGNIVQFGREPGQFLIGEAGRLSWYGADSAAPRRSLNFGADYLGEPREPVALSRDGDVVIYDESLIPQQAILMRPQRWHAALCGLLDGREFSAAEREQLPPSLSDAPVCPG